MTEHPLASDDRYGILAAQYAAEHPPAHLRWYRNTWLWIAGVVLVLVLGVRIALNPVATHFVKKALDSIEGHHARLAAVKVSVVPLTMTITDLAIEQDGATNTEPTVFVHELRAQVLWRKLFKGQLVALASLHKAKFVITVGVTEVTPQVAEAARKGAEEVKRNDFNIGAILQKVIPVRVDRLELRESEFTVIDATTPQLPSFWVSDISLVIDNMVTRKSLDENVPLTLTMRSTVAKTGTLKAIATANLLAEKPSFTGQAQMTGLKLESLYAWTSSKAGVGATGDFEVFANFNSAEGKLGGDVKVMVRNVHVSPASGKVSDALKAAAANVAIAVLSDRVEGREAVATTLPIRGSIEQVEAQVWPAILGVIRNAFIEGLDWGFSDLPKPTARTPQGVIPQAVDALDKDKSGPKAQPTGSR